MKHRWLLQCMLLLSLFSSSSQAFTIRMTMYDDGRSCPANCDAHIVFDNALNEPSMLTGRMTAIIFRDVRTALPAKFA